MNQCWAFELNHTLFVRSCMEAAVLAAALQAGEKPELRCRVWGALTMSMSQSNGPPIETLA